MDGPERSFSRKEGIFMATIVRGKNLEITPALKDYVLKHEKKVTKYGSLTLAIKEKHCKASKMAYFFVNFFFFFLSNV